MEPAVTTGIPKLKRIYIAYKYKYTSLIISPASFYYKDAGEIISEAAVCTGVHPFASLILIS